MPDFFECNWTPFGLKGGGNTFVRAMNVVLSMAKYDVAND